MVAPGLVGFLLLLTGAGALRLQDDGGGILSAAGNASSPSLSPSAPAEDRPLEAAGNLSAPLANSSELPLAAADAAWDLASAAGLANASSTTAAPTTFRLSTPALEGLPVRSVVPKDPPEPTEEQLAKDRQVLSTISPHHRDPRGPPPGWDDTQAMPYLDKTMEWAGTEDPSAWPQHVGVLEDKALFVDDYFVNETSGVVKRLVPGEKLGVVFDPASPTPAPAPVPKSQLYHKLMNLGSLFGNRSRAMRDKLQPAESGAFLHGSRVQPGIKKKKPKPEQHDDGSHDKKNKKNKHKEELAHIDVHPASFYGNVLHNGSHFLMFHRSGREVSLAVSQDGLSWERGPLLRGIRASRYMLTEDFGGEMCVQYHPEPKVPLDRWFAGVKCNKGELCMLHSENGIDWVFAGRKYGRATDTYPCVYREGNNFTAIIRRDFGTRSGWREIRGVQVLESNPSTADTLRHIDNFTRKTEWYLDLFGKDEFRRRSVYALTRTKYAGFYLGLAQVYEFAYGQEDYPPFTKDYMQPYLVTSRDGRTFDLGWLRREPLIARGKPLEFDHGVIMTAADWLTYGGYHWLYYSGWATPHERKHESVSKIGLIRWRQDRLVKLAQQHLNTTGRVLTKFFVIPAGADSLRVNAECPRGEVRVRLLGRCCLGPCASASLRDFDAPNQTAPLEFEGENTWESIAGKPVRLEFQLDGGASLYGFHFGTA